jgi:hypothetical protein
MPEYRIVRISALCQPNHVIFLRPMFFGAMSLSRWYQTLALPVDPDQLMAMYTPHDRATGDALMRPSSLTTRNVARDEVDV